MATSPNRKSILRIIADKLYIMELPAYGNSIFYSLGFFALTCLTLLLVSGFPMVFMGATWWLTSGMGVFMRSIHLWAAQAFIFIIILHIFVVFSTSAFKPPRRILWVLGGLVFFLALLEPEFGYHLRGDFSAQYRLLQAADFFNGAYLGTIINVLDREQVFGIHILEIPLIMFALLFFHYLLVKSFGIAKPYRDDVQVQMVPANHIKLFVRGGILAAAIIILAVVFPSPFLAPLQVNQIAAESPELMGQTLMHEFVRDSDTATYMDSIDPYTYDTREVYVTAPYRQYIAASGGQDMLAAFESETPEMQQTHIDQATAYFADPGKAGSVDGNPLVPAVNSLVALAKSGLYEAALDGRDPAKNPMYSLRFLQDTGAIDSEAESLHITTEEWGMVREEKKGLPLGAWWLAPIGVLNHTILVNDDNGDRDGAAILGAIVLVFILFPFIPYLNRLPEKLGLAKKIWKSS